MLVNWPRISCRLPKNAAFRRNYAKSYKDTINLPKSSFPKFIKKAQLSNHDRDILEKYIKPLYVWQRNNLPGNEFVLHDGPPYANGDVHMGHAVNKLLKDFVLRHHIANRTRVHYRPGWDCHGLPIELKAKAIKDDMLPVAVREASRRFAAETLQSQKKEFESWGVTADWNACDGIYRTFDKEYIQNQLNLFHRLYERQLIYRDLKPVYWSPSTRTALAEAELEYDAKHISPSLLIRMNITAVPSILVKYAAKPLHALVWTTTPWTLPANQAICYNPRLQYSIIRLGDDHDNHYIIADDLVAELETSLAIGAIEKLFTFTGEALEQCQYAHPLSLEKHLPFLPAEYVLADKGTGLVHTAPAHGFDDYLTSLKYRMPLKCVLNSHGKYNDEAPDFLRGKEVLVDGNRLVLEQIASNVVHLSTICHSYPIDWRTKQPVIVSATHQWFIRTDAIRDVAIDAMETVKFFPATKNDKNRLAEMIRSRPYWCVSRQRAWGTPIPAFYHRETGEVIVAKEIVDHLNSMLNADGTIDFWWTKSVAELIPSELLTRLNLKAEDIVKGPDILDIWFDSGVSWSYALDEPKVADLYLEGCDQFTGWFQSSLLTSVAVRGIAPFKAVLSHGFTVDAEKKKMSKSIGNVVHPKDIISVEGIDALRYWVASHVIGQSSISVDQNLIKQSAEHIKTLRGILKYLLGYIEGLPAEEISTFNIDYQKLTAFDKWSLNALTQFHDKTQELAKNYRFSSYITELEHYIFNQFSAVYMHASKDRLYCGKSNEHAAVVQVLLAQFQIASKILWPITPFLVEECWSYCNQARPFYELSLETLPDEWKNAEFDESVELAQKIRSQMQATSKTLLWRWNVTIDGSDSQMVALQKLHPNDGRPHNDSELCEILGVQSVRLCGRTSANVDNEPEVLGELINCDGLEIRKAEIEGELCPRCRRYEVPAIDGICSRCQNVLNGQK